MDRIFEPQYQMTNSRLTKNEIHIEMEYYKKQTDRLTISIKKETNVLLIEKMKKELEYYMGRIKFNEKQLIKIADGEKDV